MTQRKANPFVIRPSATSGQCSHVMGDYAAKELKLKRIATISDDFAFGHEQMSAFQRVFEDAGGKVVKKLWPPLVTPDYTPFIAQIGNVDGVFHGFAGSNPVKFMRAYADLGLKAKIPLLAGWTAWTMRCSRASATRPSASSRRPTTRPPSTTPSNKRFVAAMQKDYGVLPGGYSAGMYVAGQCVEAAIQKLGGKADDRKALAEALHKVSLADTPRGADQVRPVRQRRRRRLHPPLRAARTASWSTR